MTLNDQLEMLGEGTVIREDLTPGREECVAILIYMQEEKRINCRNTRRTVSYHGNNIRVHIGAAVTGYE